MQPEESDDPDRTFVERARRQQIVEAAIEAIAELGLAKATFAQIAARAQISPGLITYHFTTRDEMVGAVLRTVHERLDRAMSEPAERSTGYVSALELMIMGFVAHCAAHPAEMLALREIGAAADTPALRQRSAESRERDIEALEEMFAEGQQHGHYRTFATRPMATTLLATMQTVPRELQRLGPDEAESYGRELAAIFAAAVRRPGLLRRR